MINAISIENNNANFLLSVKHAAKMVEAYTHDTGRLNI